MNAVKSAIGLRAGRRAALAIGLQVVLASQALSVETPAPSAHGRSPVRRVENHPERRSVLILNDGRRLPTTLYDVRVLGTLKTERKLPYLVLAGRGCFECDENTSIYFYSPSDGPMRDELRQRRFAYPGREVPYDDGTTPVSEGRMFLGDCLPGTDNGAVWYMRERTESGKWESGVLIVSVRADTLTEVLLKEGFPPLSRVLQRVATGKCREVPGFDRPSEP